MILMCFCCHLSRRGVNRNSIGGVANQKTIGHLSRRGVNRNITAPKELPQNEEGHLSRRGVNRNVGIRFEVETLPVTSHAGVGIETASYSQTV